MSTNEEKKMTLEDVWQMGEECLQALRMAHISAAEAEAAAQEAETCALDYRRAATEAQKKVADITELYTKILLNYKRGNTDF